MQSVHAGMWDLPSKQHAPPLAQPHPPQTRPSHVSAPQAKRITFYKSGDSQFGGVKMAVHKRSFKCFDALLDDLSQKVPLPFGVRTVTTPRGTHTIRHLEQLQDGGCYLCSDRRQAKPINMEVATKRPGVWSHHGRRPHRPESGSTTPPGHTAYRQRRLLLVKNTEPAMRRGVVLSRRVTRSLRAFLEEASDVMQFHVRKLYTVEGRKIDNVQSLMTCPNVLVCVGREAFSPLLVNYVRKSSDDKLPGVETRTPGNGARSPPQGAQSRSSDQSEGHDSKKNMVNFGLETKKSIIHPRSDSSTRSARFSLSSEKSYGLSTVSQGRAGIMDDDIEKRVVVNKDGSLSVEMKVRFRLHNDETLQWSTQIKKAPSLTNDSCSVSQGQPHYLQQESCSDPDCNPYEPENVDYSSQCGMDANTCPCCYRQDQQDYDLWKNPVHCHRQPIPPLHSTTESHTILRHTHSSSSTSSCNSTRVVRCRARLTNCDNGSEHSQIVQEEMSVTEQHVVENDFSVVSRSCSRSEIVANGDALAERPMSAISASSHVLQDLKEDDDDLPPSASRCGDTPSETSEIQNDASKQNGIEEEEGSVCQCQSTSGVEVNECASKSRASSCKSTKETANEVEDAKTVVSGMSGGSQQSLCPDCGGWKVKVASCSNSRASNRSNNKSPKPESPNLAKDEDDTGSDVSTLSNSSNVTHNREVSMVSYGECRAESAMSKSEEGETEEARAGSVTSNRSHKSNENGENRSPSVMSAKSENSNCNAVPDSTTKEASETENTSERVASAMSEKSNASAKSSCSKKSSIKVTAPGEEEEETRSASAMSTKSEKSNCNAVPDCTDAAEGDNTAERVPSAMSAKSNASAKTTTSKKSSIKVTAPTEEEEETRSASVTSNKSRCKNDEVAENRSPSVMSAKSEGSNCKADSTKDAAEADDMSERVPSAMSAKSNTSAKSSHSKKSSIKVTAPTEEEEEARPASATSTKSRKSDCKNDKDRSPSVMSAKSESSKCNDPTTTDTAEADDTSERVPSAMSAKSNTSGKTTNSKKSSIKVTAPTEEEEEETRSASVTSRKSNKSDEVVENRSPSVASAKSESSNCNAVHEEITDENADCDNTSERVPSAMSAKSSTSVRSSRSKKSTIKVTAPTEEEEETRCASVHSERSSASAKKSRPSSAKSTKPEDETRAASVLSVKSHKSEKSQGNDAEEETRAASAVSVKSNKSRSASPSSVKSSKSKASEKSSVNNVQNLEVNSNGNESRPASGLSLKSTKSDASKKSVKSNKSTKSCQSEKSSQNERQNMEETDENAAKESRPASAISVKSTNSERVQNVGEDDDRPVSAVSVKSKSAKESRPTSARSAKSSKSHVSEKSKNENAEEETSEASAISKTEEGSASNELNAAKDEEERGESALSNRSKKSKSNCAENEEGIQEERPASVKSSKSALSVKSSKTNKSSRLASPAKGQEERPVSASSSRSKKSSQTVIATNVNDESERVTSPVSVKSSKSGRFHVIPIKTPDVIGTRASSVENGDADQDQARKSSNLTSTQELMPESDPRGPSSLSVRSCKSSKSKCSCGKTNKDTHDRKEDSEVAVSHSSAKREYLDEEDSFASVSLVLPDDQESESGESNKSKTVTPEVTKNAQNTEEVGPTTPVAVNIPTIETPGQGNNDKDANDENTRVASSCSNKSARSVRSTRSKKSCSNCGKLTTQADTNGAASPVASVKSTATTKTRKLEAPDNRTSSAMSTASVRSQKKVAKREDNASESTASDAEGEDGQQKSPSTLRPKSVGSNSSRSCKNKKDNATPQNQENASRPVSKAETASESILSHSLSAADLIKEAKAPERPESSRSKLSNKSTKSQRSKKEAELTPSCLPNASPNEVVSDWLNRIPANMLALGDEDGDKCEEDIEMENGVADEAEVKDEEVKVEESEQEEIKEEEEVEEEEEKGEVEKFEIEEIGMVTENSLPKSWQSSTTVMKVLLSSSLGRCRSMPEVSPVYGRRLSASAKELLDCLTQLQLIEPAGQQGFSVQKDQCPQFEDIISILQSLWLSEPRDTKDSSGTDQVSPPRSSSGVGMSCGSGGSGKDNANQEEEPRQDAEVEQKTEEASESPESTKATENPSSLERNPKTPTDNELETHESSSSESPPTVLRAPLSKRPSQDPDPIWVLHLLKKLEKQFINHYVNAMDDFKVKWDLEDSLILDRMITELREEVSQRIEKSVEREMKKIQSRAGKGSRVPRPPPGSNLSSDSTTDKRRRLLKVMKNHYVKTGDSLSDGEMTGENSDQRSDDEYCPCDACIAKKMAARPQKTNPNAVQAPVQKEFDLLKILLCKSSPATPAKTEVKQEEVKKPVEEDVRNLEVVEEEEEEEEEEEDEEEEEEDSDVKESSEEAKCNCQSSKDQDDEETEDSDRETVKEKSSNKEETMEEMSEEEERKREETTGEEEEGNQETTEGGESEEVSTEERSSEQESRPAVSATEGEDADVEDSEEKSDHEGENTTKSELKTDQAEHEKNQDVSLLHQFTKTSVESQPGSLEDVEQCPGSNNIEVPKLASPGGTPQKRSRSPARVKRRKAINSDSDLDNV